MFHLAGYFQDVDQGAVFQAITAMGDQALNTSGDDITVPSDLAFLSGAALVTVATTYTRSQIQSPSLRQLANIDLTGYTNADDFNQPQNINDWFDNPMSLDAEEDLQFFTDTDHGSAIEIQGFVWLSDGAITPARGAQFTIRATAAITLVQGVWTNGNLTFQTTLPAGNYDVVGMRAEGANLQAARLVFIGGAYRPGVPADVTAAGTSLERFRSGNAGIFGSFNQNAQPTLDAVGITDSAQTVFLDLIKTS